MQKWVYIFLLVSISCKSNHEDYFKRISANDEKLEEPKPGEWLHEHKEKGQTFQRFVRSNPTKPTALKNTISIQPIGLFDNHQNRQLEKMRQYLEAFFQLPVEILPAISNQIIPGTKWRIGSENQHQILAPYILDSVLIKRKSDKMVALMAISQLDLYPKPEWNFVFGLSSLKNNVGVTSIHRFRTRNQTGTDTLLFLRRLLKVSSHEIGHMFGLKHCIEARCVMNGSNSLDETDRGTLRLCSHCQRKIQFSIQFDPEDRTKTLLNFLNSIGFKADYKILHTDLN
ncbi:MAG: Zn-dependent protease [Bacteroidetes bacterium]|nr:Zn-dependent protease [Bacteroidota bacterium]